LIVEIKKRFIAGAVCPKCQQMDKIVVYAIANKKFAECVRCGYKQEAEDEKAEKPKQEPKKVIWLKQDKTSQKKD